MGGRFCYSPLDQLAKKHSVRIIHFDRPGVGGSDAVSLEDRIPTYINTIPHLLHHLSIKHVSLAAHSFGTIYLLNAMLMYPHFLHPTKPCVTFFAPWVHPSHTGIKHLQAAEMLPASMISKFSSLAKFVNGNISPLVGMSTGLSSAVSTTLKASFPHSPGPAIPIPLEPNTGGPRQSESNHQPSIDLNNAQVIQDIRKLIPTYLFAEAMEGVSQDAQLCLRKPRSVPWSTPAQPWDDIDEAARLFKRSTSQDERIDQQQRVLGVNAFHAETDGMVGFKGRAWFDACWIGDEIGGSSVCEYWSQVVQGADHDFILDPVFGASEVWLERVRGAFDEDVEREVDVSSP